MSVSPVVLMDILCKGGCFSFLRKQGEQMLEELSAGSSFLQAALTEDAKADFVRSYEKRLQFLFSHSVVMELVSFLAAHGRPEAKIALLGSNEAELAEAAAVLGQDEGLEERLKSAAPLLAPYEERIRKDFRHNAELLFARLAKDQKRIEEKLLSGTPLQVTGLSLGEGDAHRHGQMVARIATSAGNIYYKPHDCRLDVVYEELVRRWFSDRLTAAGVVEGEGYGFVSELKHSQLARQEDIGVYFYNLGMLTAFFHGLGSRDMHQENIMACGVKPAVLDVETLLAGQRKFVPQDSVGGAMNTSITGAGIMPSRIHKIGFLSALHKSSTVSCTSLPLFAGEAVGIEGYEQTYLQGFREGYRRMMEHRQEIEGMFSSLAGAVVRHVRLNTSYYYCIFRNLARKENLASEEAQQKTLEQLRIPFRLDWKDEYEILVKYEQDCLYRGEIPYFCVLLDSRDLCGETGEEVMLRDFFDHSPLENLRDHLGNLSPQEMDFETDLITMCLRHAPQDAAQESPWPLGGEPVSSKALLAFARDVWQEVLQERIRHPHGYGMWAGQALSLESYLPVGPQVSWADVARCASFLPGSETEAAAVQEDCLTGLERLLAYWQEQEKEELRFVFRDGGLYSGSGCVLAGCRALFPANQARVTAFLNEYLPLVHEHLDDVESSGAGYGLSGLLLSLTEMLAEGVGDRAAVLSCLKDCAACLAARELPEGEGGSNGKAGVAAALASAYAATGDETYALASQKVLAAVQAAYRQDVSGWVRHDEKIPWLAERAPWAPGIAWHAMTGMEKLPAGRGKEEAVAVAELALGSLQQEKELFYRDTLHEGNALWAMSMARAAQVFGRQEYLDRAANIFASVLQRAGENGAFHVNEPGIRDFFDVSFYCGTLGISYAALYCQSILGKDDAND